MVSNVKLRAFSLETKTLFLAQGLLSVLYTFRFYEYWTTGLFDSDAFRYYNEALGGAIYTDRWFFGGFNIVIFRAFGINSVDSFSTLLPFYGFFWSSLTLFAIYLILHRLGFGGVTAALAMISSFMAVSFIAYSNSLFD